MGRLSRRERDRSEDAELLGALGAGLGMVGDEHESVGAADAELLAVQVDGADLWVGESDGGPAAWGDVVACPELSEQRTRQGELTDQLDEPWVVDVGTDGLAEARDDCAGRSLTVDEQRLLFGVEEDVAQSVSAGPQPRRECGRERVGDQDVQIATLDESGHRQLGDKARRARRNGLAARPSVPPARVLGRETQEVGVVVELQYAADGLQHLG